MSNSHERAHGDAKQHHASRPPLVALSDVSFDYAGRQALRHVDFAMKMGEIVALTGANGSGKSTLLSLLAGLEKPRTGTVARAPGAVAALVAQSSSVPDSLPLTVSDIVAMGRWAKAGMWRPLTRVDREIVVQSIDDLGLATLRSRPMNELSGGQRQRAFVAQGLARRADLLLLDEPMTALDPGSRGVLANALRIAAGRGAGVCLVTHDLDVSFADRVVRLGVGGAGTAALNC